MQSNRALSSPEFVLSGSSALCHKCLIRAQLLNFPFFLPKRVCRMKDPYDVGLSCLQFSANCKDIFMSHQLLLMVRKLFNNNSNSDGQQEMNGHDLQLCAKVKLYFGLITLVSVISDFMVYAIIRHIRLIVLGPFGRIPYLPPPCIKGAGGLTPSKTFFCFIENTIKKNFGSDPPP